jgi:MFS family permease
MAIVLAVAYALAFVDRQILSLLLEPIRLDLEISDTQASLLVGAAFALFYVTLGLPLGWLADRVNRRNLIAGSIIAWSAMTAACGAAGSYLHLFLARMGVGIGEAGFSPAAVSMLGDHYPEERRSRAFGMYTAAIPLGMGAALLGGGALMAVAPGIAAAVAPWAGDVRPWQVVFCLVAAPGLLVAVILMMLREPPRRTAGVEGEAARSVLTFIWGRKGVYLPLMTGLSALTVLGYGYGAWVPTLLIRAHGWTIPQIGLWYGLIVLIFGPLGSMLGGWLCDRLLAAGRRDAHWVVVLGSLPLLGLCYALAPLMPTAWLTLAMLIPGTVAGAAPAAASHAALVQITPSRLRARTFSVYAFIQSVLGMTLGPTLIALLTDHVFVDPSELPYSMVVVAIMAGVVGTLLIWSCRRGYRDMATAPSN